MLSATGSNKWEMNIILKMVDRIEVSELHRQLNRYVGILFRKWNSRQTKK